MQFRILGPLEVDAGDGPLSLGGPKQRAVLAHLLIRANEVVPATTLIDELWGEEPPETARNTLQTYVSHLRKVVGADRLTGRAPGYVLEVRPSELDAARFDALVQAARKARPVDAGLAGASLEDALAIWRGPALADVLDDSGLMVEASRLDELRLGAEEERLGALLEMGEQARATIELEALLARFPLREGFWAQLMLALYRSGRQAEALSAFGRAREILAEELGIDPSPELTRLHERILKQDPALELRGEPMRGYRLLERLGQGRSGVVYRGIQPNVGRDVAVKVVPQRTASEPSFIRRFEPEAQAVAALEHPHIVPVYDYWREPEGAYIVSRYLAGGSLDGVVARGDALAPAHAERIVEQLRSALAFAHRRGVTHGNLRSSNVLLDDEGNAYVGDFVIADRDRAELTGDLHALEAIERSLVPGGVSRDEGGPIAEESRGIAETPIQVEPRNPYKGLRAFSEADAHDFFGRAGSIARIVGRLAEQRQGSRFLAVVGPSGSGKSSVVRAGVVPAIRAGAIAGSERWFVAELFPGLHPMEELEAALLRISPAPHPRLLDLLEERPRGLLDAADLLAPGEGQILLVIDQLEEAFTLTASEPERVLFLEALRVATADPAGRVRIVATLRADFYDRPLAYARFGNLLGERTEVVAPLTPDELELAITGPARQVGTRVESGLVAELVADVAHQPGALPLLQFALTELFERRDGELLTQDAYREIGGVAGALSSRADRLHLSLDEAGRRAARQVFLRLVTLGEGSQDTRRRVLHSELESLDVDQDAVEVVLGAFGRHRLLTFDREPSTREPTVEFAHEALLSAWGRLRGWIDQAREDLRQYRSVVRAAAEWRGSSRDPSFVLRGTRLEQLEGWSAGTSLAIGSDEREYLRASLGRRDQEIASELARREEEVHLERRSRSRLLALVAVLTVAALIASGLTLIAVDQRREAAAQAQLASARELAAAAQANLSIDPERSLLLATEAIEATTAAGLPVLAEAAEALHAAVQADRLIVSISDGFTVRYLPDGSGVVSAVAEGVAVYDPGTGELLDTFPNQGTDELSHANVSADGRYISASSRSDASTVVWDRVSGEQLFRFATPSGDPVCCWAEFSPDSSVLVSFVWDGTTRVWDLRTGEEVARLAHLGAMAFSPDSSRLWVGGCVWDWQGDPSGIGADCNGARDGVDVSWSSDGARVAVAGDQGVRLFDANTLQVGSVLLAGAAGSLSEIELSPSGDRIAVGYANGTVDIWRLGRHSAEREIVLAGHSTLVKSMKFSPDGTQLATAIDAGEVRVWDVTPSVSSELRSVAGLTGVAYSPDGRWLAAGTADGTATISDATTGRVVRSFDHRNWVTGVAFDPTGRTLATVGEGRIRVWDIASAEERFHARDKGYASPGSVAFSSDGTVVAASWDHQRTIVYDSATGEVVRILDAGFTRPAFSPDGSRLATPRMCCTTNEELDQVPVWDLETGVVSLTLRSLGGASAAAFSPDGRTVISGGFGGDLTFWDATDGHQIRRISENLGAILDIEFARSGRFVATATDDGTIRLWDPATGRELLTLAHTSGTGPWGFDIAISPDETRVAAGWNDGTVRQYVLGIDELLELARERVSRGLDEQECRQYLHVASCPD